MGVHLRWARQMRASENAARAQMDALACLEDAARIQAQAQQAAVFDSMVEGVVLLDHEGRIQLLKPGVNERAASEVGKFLKYADWGWVRS